MIRKSLYVFLAVILAYLLTWFFSIPRPICGRPMRVSSKP